MRDRFGGTGVAAGLGVWEAGGKGRGVCVVRMESASCIRLRFARTLRFGGVGNVCVAWRKVLVVTHSSQYHWAYRFCIPISNMLTCTLFLLPLYINGSEARDAELSTRSMRG